MALPETSSTFDYYSQRSGGRNRSHRQNSSDFPSNLSGKPLEYQSDDEDDSKTIFCETLESETDTSYYVRSPKMMSSVSVAQGGLYTSLDYQASLNLRGSSTEAGGSSGSNNATGGNDTVIELVDIVPPTAINSLASTNSIGHVLELANLPEHHGSSFLPSGEKGNASSSIQGGGCFLQQLDAFLESGDKETVEGIYKLVTRHHHERSASSVSCDEFDTTAYEKLFVASARVDKDEENGLDRQRKYNDAENHDDDELIVQRHTLPGRVFGEKNRHSGRNSSRFSKFYASKNECDNTGEGSVQCGPAFHDDMVLAEQTRPSGPGFTRHTCKQLQNTVARSSVALVAFDDRHELEYSCRAMSLDVHTAPERPGTVDRRVSSPVDVGRKSMPSFSTAMDSVACSNTDSSRSTRRLDADYGPGQVTDEKFARGTHVESGHRLLRPAGIQQQHNAGRNLVLGASRHARTKSLTPVEYPKLHPSSQASYISSREKHTEPAVAPLRRTQTNPTERAVMEWGEEKQLFGSHQRGTALRMIALRSGGTSAQTMSERMSKVQGSSRSPPKMRDPGKSPSAEIVRPPGGSHRVTKPALGDGQIAFPQKTAKPSEQSVVGRRDRAIPADTSFSRSIELEPRNSPGQQRQDSRQLRRHLSSQGVDERSYMRKANVFAMDDASSGQPEGKKAMRKLSGSQEKLQEVQPFRRFHSISEGVDQSELTLVQSECKADNRQLKSDGKALTRDEREQSSFREGILSPAQPRALGPLRTLRQSAGGSSTAGRPVGIVRAATEPSGRDEFIGCIKLGLPGSSRVEEAIRRQMARKGVGCL